ncbi:hypothetical protein U1Q18_013331, partial [Sarracenia purpurea var. burkii]
EGRAGQSEQATARETQQDPIQAEDTDQPSQTAAQGAGAFPPGVVAEGTAFKESRGPSEVIRQPSSWGALPAAPFLKKGYLRRTRKFLAKCRCPTILTDIFRGQLSPSPFSTGWPRGHANFTSSGKLSSAKYISRSSRSTASNWRPEPRPKCQRRMRKPADG